jgi:serine/threonine-protein kinase
VSSPISPDQWRQLESLVDALLDTPPERRGALFAKVSGGDPARQEELERLVAACERTYPLLDQPAAERFAALVDTNPLQPEQIVAGRYRITRELGRGGMATVYLAHDVKHARDVALKVVRSDLVATVGSGRFLREIEIAAQLRHPNIVPLYDSGRVPVEELTSGAERARDGVLYYVMPYEAGQTLRDRVRREGRLAIDDALVIIRDICDALAHAHDRGIVHRDIKPDNILLSGRHALVSDFGVARAASEMASAGASTGAGVLLGTPAYMAPEQVAADPHVDHRADIYAVGVVAYELLTGHPPFGGEPREILTAQLAATAEPVTATRPDVPNAVAAAVARCLAKKPADRFQSANELLQALAPASDSMASVTPSASIGIAPTQRRRWLALAPPAAVLAAAALVAVNVARRPIRTADAPDPRLAIGILPMQAASPGGDLDWLATGLGNQLSAELAQVAAFEMRPSETIGALLRAGWPFDSIALERAVDYFVKASLAKGTGDSVVVTLELIERGLRTVRVGDIRAAHPQETTVESLGRRLAERLRPMLGSRAREQELERASTSVVALQQRRRADHQRLIFRDRLAARDYAGADRALDTAVALLIASERTDPTWSAPRLARASLAGSRALNALERSGGTDTAGVQRAFAAGVSLLDSMLKRTPRDARALALRGRLRWHRQLSLAAPVVDIEAAELARRDLSAALTIDTTLAQAAADLSQLYFDAFARYDEAAAYAERAYRIDAYMEGASEILNRLARSHFELGHDLEAARWCREAIRRFPTNPAHPACLLEVMAWGTGPADADSAWTYYRAVERLTGMPRPSSRAYYTAELAAALARSGHVPADSVRTMLARARAAIAGSAQAESFRHELLALEAGVLYRLGDSSRADQLFADIVRRDPRDAAVRAKRRMLRDHVQSTTTAPPR